MQNARVKNEAKRLVEELPEDATWDDLMYKIYVRQAIEAGLRADLVAMGDDFIVTRTWLRGEPN